MNPADNEVREKLVALLPRLRRFARALSRDADDADDLVQAAVDRALLQLEQWPPETRLDCWIFGIVKNIWINETRSRRRRDRAAAPHALGETAAADAASEAPVEPVSLSAAMERLSDEQRLVVALVLVEGLASDEAAEVLDIPIDTLTGLLAGGRESLDALLGGREDGHRSLRKRIGSEFDPVLFETVPDSVVAVVHGGTRKREATVTDIQRVRAARAAEAKEMAAARRPATPVGRPPWTWVEWSLMAASIVIGAIIAYIGLRSPDTSDLIGSRNGELIAQGDLGQALDSQLSGSRSRNTPVQIGVSFRAKSGQFCRTFMVKDSSPMGGLACRDGDEWRVQVLATGKPVDGKAMPRAVVTGVEQRIAGEPLDASGEAAARASGWKQEP